MKKLSIFCLSAGTALLCAIPVSLQLSQGNLSVSLDRASAGVGEPLTAGSVAGVHRRVHRRAARRAYYGEAAAAATPYDNGNWGYWNGAGPGYGAAAVAAGVVAAPTPYNTGNWGYGYGPGPAYGVAAAPAVTSGAYYGAATPATYYGADRAYAAGIYTGSYYPTRAMYRSGYLSPSYYGPVCNPRIDPLCQ